MLGSCVSVVKLGDQRRKKNAKNNANDLFDFELIGLKRAVDCANMMDIQSFYEYVLIGQIAIDWCADEQIVFTLNFDKFVIGD